MRKYDVINFTICIIDKTDCFKKLGELERYYIRLYDSKNPNKGYNLTAGGESNQYDGNPSAKMTIDEIMQIREIYAMGELSLHECWELYKDKLSYSGFQKIWNGNSWKGIMDYVYSDENKAIHNQQKANKGSMNGNSILTENEVLNIRKYYMNHTRNETYQKYGIDKYSENGFRQVLDRTYKNVPIYSKNNKVWVLNEKVIDIDNYKPVSTISESGE